MRNLVLALYAEGRTDDRFLPFIVQRTAEAILSRLGSTTVDVMEPLPLRQSQLQVDNREIRLLEAAKLAYGFHALVVHNDGDHRGYDNTLKELIEPGMSLIMTYNGQRCTTLIPVIPIRNIEAWMACDYETFREIVGTDLSMTELGFPSRPSLVENITDPKEMLNEALRIANAQMRRNRRKIRISALYEPFGRNINLDNLKAVPAYRRFSEDMEKTLRSLGMLENDVGT